MYGVMRTDDESTGKYYIIQWTSEMYAQQEDKEIEGYKPIITAYEGEILCDTVFLNHVPNEKYLFTPMNKGVGDVPERLRQVLPPNITIMNINRKPTQLTR